MTHPSPPDIAAHKKLVRSHLRAQRKQLPPTQQVTDGFTRTLSQLVDQLAPDSQIAAFLPLPTEPPILPALERAAASGYTIYVPVVLPHHRLGWVRWEPQANTELNSLGIAEPLGQRLGPEAFSEADLRLVPALAFDTNGRRLGQGGGYYDRLLEHLPSANQASTVGVAFDREILSQVPADRWDATLTRVATETGVRELVQVTG